MDPNATLAELLALVGKFQRGQDEMPEDIEATGEQIDAWRMADLVEALHGWMSVGGFPPKEWARAAGRSR